MAALNIQEDQPTGALLLRPNIGRSLLGSLGGTIWILALAAFFLLPQLSGGQPSSESLIIIAIVILLSFGQSLGGLVLTSFTFDRTSRSLATKTNLLILPLRSATILFSDMENIEVQFYRQSSGRSSHEAYRVNAILQSGRRMVLNWDGKRDEMLALGQRIAAYTGAELLDHSERPASQLDELMQRARQLGVPIPETKTINAAPASGDPADTMSLPPMQTVPGQDQPTPEQATSVDDSTLPTGLAEPSSQPTRDFSSLSVSGLEQIVAADSSDSDARYTLARTYHAQGNLNRAIAMYQETLKVDNTNAEAQNDLGVALQLRGNRADAETAYRRAIALDPFSFNAHLNLGLLSRSMNRGMDASQEFLQARQSAQSNTEKQIAENASSGMKVEPRLSGS